MKETQENTPLAVATVVLGIVVGFSSLVFRCRKAGKGKDPAEGSVGH